MAGDRVSKKTGIVIFSTVFAFIIIAVSVGTYFVLGNETAVDDTTNIRQVHVSLFGQKCLKDDRISL